jgi:8-amino-7-oxononanoate synthase
VLGPELRPTGRTRIVLDGREYLFFAGNDYHRLASHPEVVRAACETAAAGGLSSAGSRTTTGNHPLHVELERALARFLGTEAAAILPAGYVSNAAAVEAVSADFHRCFIDTAAHSSVAAAVAGLPRDSVHRFASCDPEDLERRIEGHLRRGERPLVLTDGVFPGNGRIPPLGEYRRVLLGYKGAGLLVDDAHGMAVVGPTGKGSVEEEGLPPGSAISTGTLSKGFGAFGGVVAGSASLIEALRTRSMAFVGGTPVPPPLAAAALRSIAILEADPGMISRLRERVLRAKDRLRALGIDIPPSPAPIISVALGDEERNGRLRDHLLAAGIYPPLIRYPGSPPGGHFRFTLSSAHSDEEVERLLAAIEGGLR